MSVMIIDALKTLLNSIGHRADQSSVVSRLDILQNSMITTSKCLMVVVLTFPAKYWHPYTVNE
jgi:hypothetical protein